MISDEMVERVARALAGSKAWPAVFEPGASAVGAQAILAALDAAGYVVRRKAMTSEQLFDLLQEQHRSVGVTTTSEPPHGSDAAIALGCTCAVIDNGHGRGYMGRPGVFVISGDCPLNGRPKTSGYAVVNQGWPWPDSWPLPPHARG